MRFLLVVFFLCTSLCSAQRQAKKCVDKLKKVQDLPYICRDSSLFNGTVGCGDLFFWNVVKLKQEGIPFLLEKLSDARKIKLPVPNLGWHYTVADIAFVALQEIIDGIPTYELLGVPFEANGCGSCAYWKHLNASKKNRKQFQHRLQEWYQANKDKLVWVESNRILTGDCSASHPNGGHFVVKQ